MSATSALLPPLPLGPSQGKWTPEQDARLLELVEEKGRQWKEIGPALGRMPEGCQDRWKEIRLKDARKSGRWSQDEVERLQEAVQEVLEAKALAEGGQGGGGGGGEEEEGAEGGGSGAEGEGVGSGGGGIRVRPADRRGVLDDVDWSMVSQVGADLLEGRPLLRVDARLCRGAPAASPAGLLCCPRPHPPLRALSPVAM